MLVLVTGALGNVGLSTVAALLVEGHHVVAFDLESRKAHKLASRFAGSGERVRVVWGDLTRVESVRAALQGVDAVIHLAAIIPPASDHVPELAHRVNVDATLALIAEMEASPTAKRLVFASSQGVAGGVQDREPPLRVDTPLAPTDDYGRHKVACEEAIRKSGLGWSILRLSAVTPIRLPIQGPEIMFEFSPDARFEFLHPDDAGVAFARAVACTQSYRKILYIAGGPNCRMTFYEFVNALMGGLGIGPITVDAFRQASPPYYFGDWADTEESQRLLQYQKRGLDEQLSDMRREFRLLLPVIKVVAPLATWFVTRTSPYLKENRRRTAQR